MKPRFTSADFEAYLDEALPPERMAALEEALRSDEQVAKKLAETLGRRDAGLHSLGAIWRRNRISCPSREDLGSYLLGILPDETADYITFHLETVGCRYCRANVEDLKEQQQAAESDTIEVRRKKYFQTSAGYLSKQSDNAE